MLLFSQMAVVSVTSLAVLLVRYLVRAFPNTLQAVELLLVTIVIGLFAGLGWRYILVPKLDEPECHVAILFLSPLLVYLPGSELVYGTYEIKMGKTIIGASRLVSALVRCMFMALGLTIGWQFTGYNATLDASNQKLYSLVPTSRCSPFNGVGVAPWWLVFAVYNLAMLFPVLGGLNIHPRSFLGHYVVAYPSLLLFGALNFACPEPSCGLPSYIVNAIGLFFATNLACLREYVTGNPAVSLEDIDFRNSCSVNFLRCE